MIELKVDPEFENKIYSLTDEEFKQLEENILSDGEVYEPICVWNGVIVDGHNRWKIIQKHPEIPYQVKEMQFADKWEASDWMYKKQLGRRNLTKQQKKYLIGKLYEARKHTRGNSTSTRADDGTFQSRQNDDKGRTVKIIAKEQGIGTKTVERAEHFAQGVDKAEEVVPGFKKEILNGEVSATDKQIAEIRNLKNTDEIKTAVKEIRDPKSHVRKTLSEEEMKLRKQIEEDAIKARDKSYYAEFTIEMLVESIQISGKEYVSILKNSLVENSILLVGENRKLVSDEIASIVVQIEQIKELVK